MVNWHQEKGRGIVLWHLLCESSKRSCLEKQFLRFRPWPVPAAFTTVPMTIFISSRKMNRPRKPRLLRKNDTGEIGAFYTLTEECASVFPLRADGFLNLGELKIAEGFIQFVLNSE